ncbi:hypothetical protein Mapa_009036 [Marchantia paleacea]|nr:hypothetical protein Mapa_009036 [Marchantia paleacea]
MEDEQRNDDESRRHHQTDADEAKGSECELGSTNFGDLNPGLFCYRDIGLRATLLDSGFDLSRGRAHDVGHELLELHGYLSCNGSEAA